MFKGLISIMPKILLITLLLILQLNSVYAANSESSFTSGVQYFKQAKYNTALKYFNQAYSDGMKKSALFYNLGVTQYKLQRYKQAHSSFKRLSKDKKFRQIAYYNLGLTSESLKRKKQAIIWYNKSAKLDKNRKITHLANLQLDRLLKRKKKISKNVISSISLAAGSDDNITQAATNSPSNRSDSYTELFAYAKAPLSKNMNIKGSLYLLNFNSLSTENFKLFSVAIDYSIKRKNWKIIPELGLYNSTLSSTNFQQITDFKLTAKQKLKNNASLALRYRLSNISSQNAAYDYLKGQRHQLRADYKTRIKNGKVRLRYQLEFNNRQNLSSANYSPTRHNFRARLQHSLSNNWRLSEEADYRISQYGDAAGVTRNDQRLRLRFIATKQLARKWAAGIRYVYTNNTSNIYNEKYNRNNIQIFTNWDF